MNEDNTQRVLGKLEATMSALQSELKRIADQTEDLHKDLEVRLRKVEEKQTYVAGMAAAVGILASVGWEWIKSHFKTR